MFKVNVCAVLPVHGHSTMFLCVRAYSAVGNVQTKCQMALIEIETEHNRDAVYDIDMNSSSWETIKEVKVCHIKTYCVKHLHFFKTNNLHKDR